MLRTCSEHTREGRIGCDPLAAVARAVGVPGGVSPPVIGSAALPSRITEDGGATRGAGELHRVEPISRPDGEDMARRQAVQMIERKRHFHGELLVTAIGMAILIAVWAASEHHNAGDWPTRGFSQSSGMDDKWNYWIIYPVVGVALIVAARVWCVYDYKPISEGEIEREMERKSGRREPGTC